LPLGVDFSSRKEYKAPAVDKKENASLVRLLEKASDSEREKALREAAKKRISAGPDPVPELRTARDRLIVWAGPNGEGIEFAREVSDVIRRIAALRESS
jgi:hypothetical protein